MLFESSAGKSNLSELQIVLKTAPIYSFDGAGTLTCKHLDLTGYMTLDKLSQLAMILQKGM